MQTYTRKAAATFIAVSVTALAQAQAAVLVHESFGDAADGGGFDGYSGTEGTTETGFASGSAWASSNDGTVVELKERDETGWGAGISGGYSVDSGGGSQEHWVEQLNMWNLTTGTRSLGASIDLSTDGTHYMSFFSRSGGTDVVLQLGLSDGTSELMWGQGYNRGITAYHGALGTNAADANQNNTDITITNWESVFWVAKLEKTNSGTTDDLAVSIDYFDLATDNNVGGGAPESWARTVDLAGVDSSFDSLRMKVDGGSDQWPGMDEFRVGESWTDVTGVPEPSVALLGVFGLIGLSLRRR